MYNIAVNESYHSWETLWGSERAGVGGLLAREKIQRGQLLSPEPRSLSPKLEIMPSAKSWSYASDTAFPFSPTSLENGSPEQIRWIH